MKPHFPASLLFGRSPGSGRTHLPILAHLSVLCLLFPAGAAVSCGTADPFLSSTEVQTTIFLPDILALEEHPTKASTSGIDRLDIFVYNDDEVRRLDSYCSIGTPETAYLQVNSSAGDKLVVILANCTGRSFTYDEFKSYSSLESVVWRLKDEDPARPVMSGECQISAGA